MPQLTPRADTMQGWDDIPEAQRPFQRRLMEVFAGFLEHVDVQVEPDPRRAGPAGQGRQHDRHLHLRRQRLERRGAERQHQRTAGAEQHSQHGRGAAGRAREARRTGGSRHAEDRQHVPRRLGMGRQHAVSPHQARGQPFRRHAQSDGDRVAATHHRRRHHARPVPPRERHRAHALRGPRHPASAASWTATSRSRSTASAWPTRSIARTRPPARRCSTSRTTPAAASTPTAGTPAPSGRSCRGTRRARRKRLANWDADTEPWELYHLDEDFSQANDLAEVHPGKLEELKALFKEVSRDNLVWPIGAGLWLRIHPEDRIASPYTQVAIRRRRAPGCPSSPHRDWEDRTATSRSRSRCRRTRRACSTRWAGSPAV